jgi:hypothetical protein
MKQLQLLVLAARSINQKSVTAPDLRRRCPIAMLLRYCYIQ